VPEGSLRVHALFPAHTAVNAYNRLFPAQQRRNALLELVQRVPMLSEKDELLGRRRFQGTAGAVRRGFAIAGERPSHCGLAQKLNKVYHERGG
jgi:hypothetical protein